jgi:hypothetical protein
MDNILNPFRFPVSPTDSRFGGLRVWFDAADITTIKSGTAGTGASPVNGGTVGSWVNKGSAFDYMNQTIVNDRPFYIANQFNGRGVVRFDGDNDSLNRGSTAYNIESGLSGITVYSVTKGNLTGQIQYPFCYVWITPVIRVRTGLRLNSGGNAGMTFNTNRIYNDTTGQQAPTISFGGNNGTNHNCISVVCNYSIGEADSHLNAIPKNTLSYTNGSGVAQTQSNRFYLGSLAAGAYYGGDICEILIYDNAHTTVMRRQIEEYLYNKWRIV